MSWAFSTCSELWIDTVGGIIGPWFAGPLTDRLGRRGGMFIGG